VLLQIRSVSPRSKGGIVLVEETKSDKAWNTQVGRVVAVGPLAFRNRSTGEKWPEGMWCSVGDFVRMPRWGGDRWERPVAGSEDRARFVIFNDHELIARITCDPRTVEEYIL
jgi:co-chaperonin GroES (HSP10)